MSNSSKPVKLDAMGETQQMLVMLSIMREVMKPLEKPIPAPPPRPDWISEMGYPILERKMDPWDPFDVTTIGPHSDDKIDEFLVEINKIEETLNCELNKLCWYVELPNQPVSIPEVDVGSAVTWEIRSWESFNDEGEVITGGMRLGWLPESGLMVVRQLIWKCGSSLLDSEYMRIFREWNTKPESKKLKESRLKSMIVKQECTGMIYNNWLYLTSALQFERFP